MAGFLPMDLLTVRCWILVLGLNLDESGALEWSAPPRGQRSLGGAIWLWWKESVNTLTCMNMQSHVTVSWLFCVSLLFCASSSYFKLSFLTATFQLLPMPWLSPPLKERQPCAADLNPRLADCQGCTGLLTSDHRQLLVSFGGVCCSSTHLSFEWLYFQNQFVSSLSQLVDS